MFHVFVIGEEGETAREKKLFSHSSRIKAHKWMIITIATCSDLITMAIPILWLFVAIVAAQEIPGKLLM